MRILILTQFLTTGGLERMVYHLCRGLKELPDHQPAVAWYDDDGCGPTLEAELHALGIPTYRLDRERRFSLKTVFRIHRAARAHGATVIHTHDVGPLLHGVLAKWLSFGRYRIVHTQHGFAYPGRTWRRRLYDRFFAKFADRLSVVASPIAREYEKRGIDPKRIELIPNGVSFPELSSDWHVRRRIRAELLPTGALAERFWILCLGRIHPGKGQSHVLDLWARLSPSVREQCVLLFVGPVTDPGESARLQRLLEDLPEPHLIQFTGGTSRPEDWIGCADLFISASEYEGSPLAALEAVGSGTPSFLSEIPAHLPLQEYCRFFRLDRLQSAATRLERMILDLMISSDELRQLSWVRGTSLREKSSIRAMTRQYVKLYDSASL